MKRKEFYALGVMSGTSTDGLDFSLIKSDGKEKIKIIQNKYYKFNHKFKMKILNAINEFKQLKKSNKENKIFKNLNEDFSKYVLKKLNLFFDLIHLTLCLNFWLGLSILDNHRKLVYLFFEYQI